jgi:DNA-binding NtrC family response regulator
MIVDDEQIVCDRLKALVERDGHRAKTFVDPDLALERLAQEEFDIVISDVRMAEIDGIQLMQLILDHSPRVKVILITGYATMQMARESMGKGAFDFIAKPFKFREIRATLAQAIEALRRERTPAVGSAAS